MPANSPQKSAQNSAQNSSRDPDWTRPGAYPVAEGVHRIPLPLPLAGLTAVNVYVLEGPDGLVVVDSGWQSAKTRTALEAGLRQLGHGLDDIDTFLITHMHWDHYTMAAELRDTLRCRIQVGAEERDSILGYDQEDGVYAHRTPLLRAAGADDLAAEVESRPLEPYETDIAYGPPDHWLVDGDRTPVADGALEAIATPGHTRGHMVFSLDTAGVLFTGDHVLPGITPAVGNDGHPATSPLRNYLASLHRLLDRPDAVMLPAHGPVGGSVHTRVKELIGHHDERLQEILELVGDGRATAMQVAAAVPWTRRRLRLDELDAVHRMTAVLEVDAHLSVLAERGHVVTQQEDGVRRFARAH
ncbi:MBL fold metallo-hydrolase [Streptomyces sp. NPDC085927]|uniref:MBL fold metallo-hydrolase n=1 Tax=Streptomyces sp. NPDC085927 TaxID=3365738 RepID=UPI0037D4B417